MNQSVISPEFVINPEPSKEHDEKISKTLPSEFLKDLEATREKLGTPDEYLAGIANPYDYVAFVAEAIHHATPYYYHRYVTSSDFAQYIADKHPAEFKEAKRAHEQKTQSRLGFAWGYASYVDDKVIASDEIDKWWTWMTLVNNADRRITRNDVKGTMTDDEFNAMLSEVGAKGGERTEGGPAGFHAAVISCTQANTPINPGKPALKRRLSDAKFRETLPPKPGPNAKRAFFRTWVRVVPEGKAATLRKAEKERKALAL